MSSFEWIELESLSLEISNAELRLTEALSGELFHIAKDIETQIANAKARREHILESISQNTASSLIKPNGQSGTALPEEGAVWTENARHAEDNFGPFEAAAMEPSEIAPTLSGSDDTAAPLATEEPDPAWERLPVVLERARRDIERRRTEILARHAEELKALDAEDQEIDALERALEAFARRFSRRPTGAEVVRLDQERDLRMHGHI
ncbi:MAG TPA: hypothetical protein VHU15_00455 [Stellaceae bacterium]|jgi:hypothetical protein|nr:hypothetical protein [Stellaceae bacterium]